MKRYEIILKTKKQEADDIDPHQWELDYPTLIKNHTHMYHPYLQQCDNGLWLSTESSRDNYPVPARVKVEIHAILKDKDIILEYAYYESFIDKYIKKYNMGQRIEYAYF